MNLLSHCKVCELEDFSHPDFVSVVRDIFAHELARRGPDFPAGYEFRKDWEVTMSVRAMRDGGAIRPDAEILGVGAGTESTHYYLTNHVRRVFATDLYIPDPPPPRNPNPTLRNRLGAAKRAFLWRNGSSQSTWHESANLNVLRDPGRYWPGPWNPRRLVMQHMNGLDLQYEDGSFDGIYSSGSIEHFGGHSEVRQAVCEMYRVLKPGGILSVSTEFRLDGPSPGFPGVLLFDAAELQELFLDAAPWEPLSPFSAACSQGTRATEQDFDVLSTAVAAHVATFGDLQFHKLDFPRYPHLVLRRGQQVWGSCHLGLRKV